MVVMSGQVFQSEFRMEGGKFDRREKYNFDARGLRRQRRGLTNRDLSTEKTILDLGIFKGGSLGRA
jgi:hypothetical protein